MHDKRSEMLSDDHKVFALGPFNGTGVGLLLNDFLTFLKQSGVADAVGGPEILEQGINDLMMGSLPLVGELMAAKRQQVSLADAVYAPDNWPHLAIVHGFLVNLLTMNVPTELLPWAKRLLQMAPPPDVGIIRRTLVATAIQDPNPMASALSRFIVFEAVCFIQRLALLQAGVHVETMGGQRQDIEVLAECELQVLEDEVYQAEVLANDDPLRLLQICGVTGLTKHIDVLKSTLAFVTKEVHEHLEKRRQILEIAARLDPKDGLVLLNETAEIFDEERVAAHQLRRLNAGHLGGLSDEAIWQRKKRLPAKVKALSDTTAHKGTTFANLILRAADGKETDR